MFSSSEYEYLRNIEDSMVLSTQQRAQQREMQRREMQDVGIQQRRVRERETEGLRLFPTMNVEQPTQPTGSAVQRPVSAVPTASTAQNRPASPAPAGSAVQRPVSAVPTASTAQRPASAVPGIAQRPASPSQQNAQEFGSITDELRGNVARLRQPAPAPTRTRFRATVPTLTEREAAEADRRYRENQARDRATLRSIFNY